MSEALQGDIKNQEYQEESRRNTGLKCRHWGWSRIKIPQGNLIYKRGEIPRVNLNPTIGAEAQKIRACLIIQNDIMNQHGLLMIVMPFRAINKQASYLSIYSDTVN